MDETDTAEGMYQTITTSIHQASKEALGYCDENVKAICQRNKKNSVENEKSTLKKEICRLKEVFGRQ